MSRSSTLILFGILVILTPFSGLPISLRSLLLVIFGACVCGLGFSQRVREARSHQQSVETPPSPPTISSI
ncbi:MAG: hypothetical protein NUV60_00470 [Patescibacteria group bacterium]|nr:hypothetical protein [Patescibacteria group bacterium]